MRLVLRGTTLPERAQVRGLFAAERELAARGITLSRLAALAAGAVDDAAAEEGGQAALQAALAAAYGASRPEASAELVLVVSGDGALF